MKNLIKALFISIAFLIAGCGSEHKGHSHGEDGDHSHEVPAQQSSEDGRGAVRIGSSQHSHDSYHNHAADSTHSHGNHEHSHDEKHSHAADSTHSHGNDGHSHDGDSTHSHGDKEHSH